jgi:hypothetical protein
LSFYRLIGFSFINIDGVKESAEITFSSLDVLSTTVSQKKKILSASQHADPKAHQSLESEGKAGGEVQRCCFQRAMLAHSCWEEFYLGGFCSSNKIL